MADVAKLGKEDEEEDVSITQNYKN